MSMKTLLSAAVIAGVGFAGAALWSVPATAQEDCPRGTLDARYCDRNGDLVSSPLLFRERHLIAPTATGQLL